VTSRLGKGISKSLFYGVGIQYCIKVNKNLFQEHIKEYLERLATSEQQGERSLLKWNLILADRDDIIASLKVRHFKASADTGHQLTTGGEEPSQVEPHSR
jgi:hypothetical protein